ncbi:MAG: UvrD-helicase domain-containing protein [Candidatus Riesia sp.]|nr:UvrD-helicase domain-containing protein [Candidatus Riesia sp.]
MWSEQQNTIFEAGVNGKSLLVEAGPGSGKSTTLVEQAKRLPGKVLVIVFNNTTANELQSKMPDNVTVSTMHSLGNSICKSNPGKKFEFNKWLHDKKFGKRDKKINQVFFYALKDQGMSQREANNYLAYLSDVCDKIRLHLVDYKDEQAVINILDHYNLPVDRLDLIQECMLRMDNALLNKSWVDFTDMVTAPIRFNMDISGAEVKNIPYYLFDHILIDEAQDTSNAVIEIIKKLFTGKQIIAAGDVRQSINQFAGAATDSMQQLQKAFNMTILPLTITYRCPKVHVDYINDIFGTNLICGNTRTGFIERIAIDDIVDYVELGDAIISRIQNGKDAKLIPVMQQLIREGKPCRLLGFDLVGTAKSHFNSKFKGQTLTFNHYYDTEQMLIDTREYMVEKKWSPDVIDKVISDIEMVSNLLLFFLESNTNKQWEDFTNWLYNLETEKNSCITLSSTHKFKGAEAHNIFILDSDKLPMYRDGQKEWQKISEDNVYYVALSRSLEGLYLCN